MLQNNYITKEICLVCHFIFHRSIWYQTFNFNGAVPNYPQLFPANIFPANDVFVPLIEFAK